MIRIDTIARSSARPRSTRSTQRWSTQSLVLAFFALVTLILPSTANAGGDLHEVTWGHPSSNSVQSFILFISPEIGSVELARQVDVGVPVGQSFGGTLVLYSAIIATDPDEFIAVAAVGRNGQMSELSAWGQVQPSQPGQPVLVVP